MKTITAHCLVKNEDVFIEYAIRSVIDVVDAVLIFDTGSTDNTVNIIERLVKEYPTKIIFEEKGTCDKVRHTQLRQEMIERTKTDWFMILDGDEVWTRRGMDELVKTAQTTNKECIIAPFYLCVGDIFHTHKKEGAYIIGTNTGHLTIRACKKIRGIHWDGEYGNDALYDSQKMLFYNEHNTTLLTNRFWHCTHLRRSSWAIDEYSSGDSRIQKQRLMYTFLGKKILESIPEVFTKEFQKNNKVSFIRSCANVIIWSIKKHTKNFGRETKI